RHRGAGHETKLYHRCEPADLFARELPALLKDRRHGAAREPERHAEQLRDGQQRQHAPACRIGIRSRAAYSHSCCRRQTFRSSRQLFFTENSSLPGKSSGSSIASLKLLPLAELWSAQCRSSASSVIGRTAAPCSWMPWCD